MNESESDHWKKGAVIGFYAYLVVLFINITYEVFAGNYIFSMSFVFWIGLIAAFSSEWVFNFRKKKAHPL